MDKTNTAGANLSGSIIEYISGMRLIKAYNMESRSFKKYKDAIDSFHELWVAMSKKLANPIQRILRVQFEAAVRSRCQKQFGCV